MRYYQMSQVDISGECPLYSRCRTGQCFSKEACTGIRCNTFYQIDTIKLHVDSPWGPSAIAKCGSNGKPREQKTDIARVVEEHLVGIGRNGNSHSSKANGSAAIINTISAGIRQAS
jgi:hypothetical protein